MAAAIRQYGQSAQMNTAPPTAITLLVSQVTPLRHPDLPSEGMRAEALALVPAATGMPQDGSVVRGNSGGWQVESSVPLDRIEASQPAPAMRLYQLQLVRLAQ